MSEQIRIKFYAHLRLSFFYITGASFPDSANSIARVKMTDVTKWPAYRQTGILIRWWLNHKEGSFKTISYKGSYCIKYLVLSDLLNNIAHVRAPSIPFSKKYVDGVSVEQVTLQM